MTNFFIFPIINHSSSPEVKNEWMDTSTNPISLNGLYTGTTSPSKAGLHEDIGLSDETQEKLYCELPKTVLTVYD
jgi:hypothetical protein